MPAPLLTVRQVMQTQPVCLPPDAPIQEALLRMNEFRVGAVLVVDTQQRLQGIFTERDFLRQTTTAEIGWRKIPLRDWMSPQPYTISPDAGWEEAVTTMFRLRVRHLPVVEGQRVVGIVSSRQLMGMRNEYLKQMIDERTRELKQVNDQLLSREMELNHYMKVAARLQQRFVLPQQPPEWPEIQWGVHFAPLDPLGGDFYDFARPDSEHLGIFIADASGHSIPAALHAIMARFTFQEAAAKSLSPGEVLNAMNTRMQELTEDRFVTAFYGVMQRCNCRLTYANAGHPFPMLFSQRQDEVIPLSARGFPLGISPDEQYREKTIDLAPGDRLCFFTDGLPDLCNEMGESFGSQRIGHFLLAHRERPVEELTQRMVEHLKQFQGTRKSTDDTTILIAGVESR